MGNWKWMAGRWLPAAVLAAGLLCGRATAAFSDAEFEELLQTARTAMADRLPNVAERRLRRYLEEAERRDALPPDAETAVVLLVRALHEQGRAEAILDVLEIRDGWVRKTRRPGLVTFWRAVALFELERHGDALALLEGLAADGAGEDYAARADRLRAWCLLKIGRVDEALDAFEGFDARGAESPEYGLNLLDWGRALLAAGQAQKARTILERLIGLEGAETLRTDARYWRGRALRDLREWEEARKAFTALGGEESASPDRRADAWFGVGEVEEAQQRYEEALVALRTGMELAADPVRLREGALALGRILLLLNRFDEAGPLLKQYVAANPDRDVSRSAQLSFAGALLKAGHFDRAAAEYRNYLETFSDTEGQAQAYFGRGSALAGMGRFAEAAAAYGKAYETFPESGMRAESLFKGGDAYLANGQHGLARENFERVLAEFPESALVPGAMYQIAESLAGAGDIEAAGRALMDVTEAYPEHAVAEEALYRLGRLMAGSEAWDDAILAYERLMSTYSNGLFEAEALYGRGVAHFRLFAFSKALADFERVVVVHPESRVAEQAEFQRAVCYYWMGRDEEALAACRAFIARHGDSGLLADVMFWVAECGYNRGRYEQAEKDFVAFAERFAGHALAEDALLWAGRAAAHRKEYVRSVELLTSLIKLYPECDKLAEVRFAQADALRELANHSAAILILDEIINTYPDSELVELAWGLKGDCQFTLGAEAPERYRESIAAYRVVANSSTAGADLVLQAAYKIGRSLEKLERVDEALEQYYAKVIVRFLRDREKGVWHNETAKFWFARAAFDAADILEARDDWGGVVRVLERVAQAGVPASVEARERIKAIRAERWWMFY